MKKLLAIFLILAMMLSLFALTACDSDKNDDGDDAGDTDDVDKGDGKDDGKDDAAKLETETFTIGCIKYDVPKGYNKMSDPSESTNGFDFTGLHVDMTTGASVSAGAQVEEGDSVDGFLPETVEDVKNKVAGSMGELALEDIEVARTASGAYVVTFTYDATGMTMYYTQYLFAKVADGKVTNLILTIGELDENRPVGLAANPR